MVCVVHHHRNCYCACVLCVSNLSAHGVVYCMVSSRQLQQRLQGVAMMVHSGQICGCCELYCICMVDLAEGTAAVRM